MSTWLTDTARAAADLALREIDKGIKVHTKPNGTPVTSVDLAVDRFLADAIADAYPDDVLLSEERPDPADRLDGKRAWIVDPIDGTSIMMRGGTSFGVLLACWESGAIVESVACFPVVGVTMYARAGSGCQANGRAARVSALAGAQAKVACTVKGLEGLHTLPRPIEGHSLEVARLASGELEGCVFPGGPTCGEHDYAWADCVLREAGGQLTDESGAPVRFNKPVRSMPRVLVCSNGIVHDDLIKAIRTKRR